jgi:hypothetical protein
VSLASLRQARDVLKRAANEECVARSRIHEIVSILEHTAVSLLNGPVPIQPSRRGVINPTAGSHIRTPQDVRPQWDEKAQMFIGGVDPATGQNIPYPMTDLSAHERVSLTKAEADPSNGSSGSPAYYSDNDPNAIFTFAPGSDFVAPCVPFVFVLQAEFTRFIRGPGEGPLAFEVPPFIGDQGACFGRSFDLV